MPYRSKINVYLLLMDDPEKKTPAEVLSVWTNRVVANKEAARLPVGGRVLKVMANQAHPERLN